MGRQVCLTTPEKAKPPGRLFLNDPAGSVLNAD
jgi:hypothetical protein